MLKIDDIYIFLDKDMNLDKDMTDLEFVKIRIISAYEMNS